MREPYPLGRLAMRAVGDWISQLAQLRMPQLTKVLSKNKGHAQPADVLRDAINDLKSLFEHNVPFCLYGSLAEELFRVLPALVDEIKRAQGLYSSMGEFLNQVSVIISFTELLVSRNLRRLHIERTPKVMRHIFYANLSALTGIRDLDLASLSGGWKTNDMEPLVLGGLQNMHQLQVLVLNYDATDNLIRLLIGVCPRILSIDFSCSKNITNDSVDLLVQLRALRMAYLNRTRVTMDGYIRMLLQLRRLEDVGHYDELGRCLEYIDTYHEDRTELRLRNFVSNYVTTEHVQALSRICPDMMKMSIFCNATLIDLMSLIAVDALSNLKLLACDFFSDHVRHLLDVKGCNLTHLHLEHVDEIDLNALIYISQFCPDLQVLTIYNCDLVDSTSLCMQKYPIPPFINLQRLTLAAQCRFWHLDFLLGSAYNIQFIYFGTKVPVNDDLIAHVLARNPLEQLEDLRIMHSDELTIQSAYKLIETCDNLVRLTELECWTLVTECELESFRAYIKGKNIDLDIKSQKFQ